MIKDICCISETYKPYNYVLSDLKEHHSVEIAEDVWSIRDTDGSQIDIDYRNDVLYLSGNSISIQKKLTSLLKDGIIKRVEA